MYAWFNYIEAVLWIGIATFFALCIPRATRTQSIAVLIGWIAFVGFGMAGTLARDSGLPFWCQSSLACGFGAGILAAHYTYIGWRKFSIRDRTFLLGIVGLIAFSLIIWFQYRLMASLE